MTLGDKFYLFSDGYIDQFGGPREKRFGSRQLSKLILEISELGIKEQGNIITSRMEEWKGGFDQIDDITFMGFKV